MGYTDQDLSTLARNLEPYFKQILMRFVGGVVETDGEEVGVDKYEGWGGIGITINGANFPNNDMTGGARGLNAVDLQLNPSDDPDYCAQADYSAILGGEYNNIHSTAEAAVAGGSGADVPRDAKCAFVMGAYINTPGDCQSGRYTFGKSLAMSGSWQDIASLYIEPEDKTVTFEAMITGIEGSNAHSFRIVGVAENDGGVMSILYSSVTTEHGTYSVQVVANGTHDRIDFQASGASGTCKWVLRIDTAEIHYAV